MTAEVLSSLYVSSVALTPKADPLGKEVVLKVFWPTTTLWSEVEIAAYQNEAPMIAERLINERYWNKDGEVSDYRFTCEDFAIRVLVEFSSKRGLPVKLKTGVRTYKNMESYSPAVHDRYASNMYGFAEMVMFTYGAREMQNTVENTTAVASVDDLKPGDILAQALDRPMMTTAHHIQMAVSVTGDRIDICQGNTDAAIVWPFTWAVRFKGENMADPQSGGYVGLPIEKGYFTKDVSGWTYYNPGRGVVRADFLKAFEFYRWNFVGFNKE
ncbi:hypothetical protein ACIQU2_17415 [Pseudomonas sp. NPDC098740]|uniref:hypothetical protein n=1 Tax=Pseudomonas TaxID=286 RepID=UPI0024B331D0|nr:hypothetical protein [Pseudomonas sp. PMCC200367]